MSVIFTNVFGRLEAGRALPRYSSLVTYNKDAILFFFLRSLKNLCLANSVILANSEFRNSLFLANNKCSWQLATLLTSVRLSTSWRKPVSSSFQDGRQCSEDVGQGTLPGPKKFYIVICHCQNQSNKINKRHMVQLA